MVNILPRILQIVKHDAIIVNGLTSDPTAGGLGTIYNNPNIKGRVYKEVCKAY